jgi:hypothetical protein
MRRDFKVAKLSDECQYDLILKCSAWLTSIDAALEEPPQLRRLVIVNRRGKPYTRDGFQSPSQRGMTKAFPENADRFTLHDIRAKSLSDAPTLEEASAALRRSHLSACLSEAT